MLAFCHPLQLTKSLLYKAIEGDMTKDLPFEDEAFDIVFHPVSNCYVEDVQPIFNEVYRVLKKGGIFLAGLNNEINYIVDNEEKEIIWKMPFNPQYDRANRRTIITLLDIYKDTNGFGRLHELNIKSYIATKSVK